MQTGQQVKPEVTGSWLQMPWTEEYLTMRKRKELVKENRDTCGMIIRKEEKTERLRLYVGASIAKDSKKNT